MLRKLCLQPGNRGSAMVFENHSKGRKAVSGERRRGLFPQWWWARAVKLFCGDVWYFLLVITTVYIKQKNPPCLPLFPLQRMLMLVTHASSPFKERSRYQNPTALLVGWWGAKRLHNLCPCGSSPSAGIVFPGLLLVTIVLCVLLLLNFVRKFLQSLWSTEGRDCPGFIFLACWEESKKKRAVKWKKATRFCWL